MDIAWLEWSNSHWVQSPRVLDLAGGRTVLDLWGTDWDAVVTFPEPRSVRLALRRYRHSGGWTVVINLASETYQIVSEPGSQSPLPPGKLEEIAPALDAATDRADAFFRRGQPVPVHPRASGRHAFAAWRTALQLLLGALAAIAALTYLFG